ncbi:hypothetical protein K1X76_04885, partial [bacterium]|nr:hypothetical protein [bacterium]
YGFQVGGMTPPMLPTGYTGNNFYGASAGLTNYNRSQTGVSLAIVSNETVEDMRGASLTLGANISEQGNIGGFAVGVIFGNYTRDGAINALAIGAAGSVVNDSDEETTCSVRLGILHENVGEDSSVLFDVSCPMVTDPLVSYFQSWSENDGALEAE